MSGVSVRKRKKTYRSFGLSIAGLTAKKDLGELVFSEGINCDFSKGNISVGLGAEQLKNVRGVELVAEFSDDEPASVCVYFEHEELETGASVCALLKDGRLLFYNASGRTFSVAGEEFPKNSLLLPVYQKGVPAAIAVIGERGVRVAYPSGEITVMYEKAVSSVAAFYHGRIFFTDGFTVRYGAPFVFDDYEEDADGAGAIELGSEGGELVALVSVGEKLFVVRQHGLAEISAVGAAREFAVKRIAYGGGEIKKGGVCAVRERLIFLASDGVYRYLQGEFTKLVSGKLEDLDEEKAIAASAAGDKYRLAYTDKNAKKKALVVDGEDGSCYLSFVLYGLQNGSFTAGIRSCRFFKAADKVELPSDEECYARVFKVDFGESGEKVVRKISCIGRGKVALTISSNRGEKKGELVLTPKDSMQFALKGREFDIEISLQNGAVIERIEVEYDLIGGVK